MLQLSRTRLPLWMSRQFKTYTGITYNNAFESVNKFVTSSHYEIKSFIMHLVLHFKILGRKCYYGASSLEYIMLTVAAIILTEFLL